MHFHHLYYAMAQADMDIFKRYRQFIHAWLPMIKKNRGYQITNRFRVNGQLFILKAMEKK
jgi:hypothetical protein